MRTEILTGSDWAFPILGEWRALLNRSRFGSPCQTPEWIGAWCRVFGRSKRPVVWSLWMGSDLVGLWPLYSTAGPLRVLRAMGTGHSDYLHPLLDREHELAGAEMLADFLTSDAKADWLDLHQIRETNSLRLVGAKVGAQANCLALDLPSTFEEYQRGLNKSLRYETRRIDKPPYATGEARIWTPQTPEERLDAFRILVDLHNRRWRKRGLPGSFATSRVRRFHEDWIASSEHTRLRVLFRREVPIGAIYVMHAGGAAYFFQAGFDPAAKAESPGTVLVSESIRLAIDEGMAQFDFMRGDEPYKRRWKPQHAYRNLRMVRPVTKIVGRVASSTQHAIGRLTYRIQSSIESKDTSN